MSGLRSGEIEAAELYLRTLTNGAPSGSLLDIRYRTRERRFARMFLHVRDAKASRTIVRIGQYTDVYVGCAARIRQRGTRSDVAPTALLWADCDDAQALAAARAFTPRASMIVASGGLGRAHAYWSLTQALDPAELEAVNRRLAERLGADVRCADATRILRIPGTWNHKYNPPRPVELVGYSDARYMPAEILAALPSPDRTNRGAPHDLRLPREQDPLHQIEPAHYVRLLTGRSPDNEGKVACPFHQDDKPSLHVYPTPKQGWACYGCSTPDGKPFGGDIYTFASSLWGIPSRGPSFLDLQARLDDVFAVMRGRNGQSVSTVPRPGEDGRELLIGDGQHSVER
jgi:hypothetical protein